MKITNEMADLMCELRDMRGEEFLQRARIDDETDPVEMRLLITEWDRMIVAIRENKPSCTFICNGH